MATPVDVLFHRYFQSEYLSCQDREYIGKKDLETLSDSEGRSLLTKVQSAFNDDLASVTEYRFHFDYVDAKAENAIAFIYEGFSFVGVTMPLIYKLWDVCVLLSRSDSVASVLAIHVPDPVEYEALHALLFRTQLNFVISHEVTHHLFKHTGDREGNSPFFNEINGCQDGDLTTQAKELDADGNAIYLVLRNLIAGEGRSQALAALQIENLQAEIQDQRLLSVLVIAVGAFFFVRPSCPIDNEKLFKLTHPPQAARMDRIMLSAVRWCRQYNRPELESWISSENRFADIMNRMAGAVWGLTGGRDWSEQTAFLRSPAGGVYMHELDQVQRALPS